MQTLTGHRAVPKIPLQHERFAYAMLQDAKQIEAMENIKRRLAEDNVRISAQLRKQHHTHLGIFLVLL